MRSDGLCYEVLMRRHEMNPFGVDHWRNSLAVFGYVEKAEKIFEHKRPFILDSGDIGMAEGVHGLEKEDVVCLFMGAPFPFIVRKEADHYISVGSCFIHDYMGIPRQAVFVDAKEFAIR